jgi:hypothetical protein
MSMNRQPHSAGQPQQSMNQPAHECHKERRTCGANVSIRFQKRCSSTTPAAAINATTLHGATFQTVSI